MNIKTLNEAIEEAKRFLKRANELKKITGKEEHFMWHPKETGAVRRASMDLTRSLADLRRYK